MQSPRAAEELSTLPNVTFSSAEQDGRDAVEHDPEQGQVELDAQHA